jgi:hypothetical protein
MEKKKIKVSMLIKPISTRDSISLDIAFEDNIQTIKEGVQFIKDGDFQACEDHLCEELRLEPDIIETFIFQFI